MPDNRRDAHKMMVVAKTRPHDGSVGAMGDASGTDAFPAGAATAGLAAPRGSMSVRASGLLAHMPGTVVAAAPPCVRVAGVGSAATVDLSTSGIGSHQ